MEATLTIRQSEPNGHWYLVGGNATYATLDEALLVARQSVQEPSSSWFGATIVADKSNTTTSHAPKPKATTKYRAVRVAKGIRKIVQVIDTGTGQVVATAGGARAERAKAVVVSFWSSGQRTPNLELRLDPAAAQALAAGYLHSREVKQRGRVVGVTNVAVYATAVLIEA